MYTHPNTRSTDITRPCTWCDVFMFTWSNTCKAKLVISETLLDTSVRSRLQIRHCTYSRAQSWSSTRCVTLTSRSIFRDANVFALMPTFSHTQRCKGHTDSYTCTCPLVYYTLLYPHVHPYTYIHVHTCTIYPGQLLESPSVTRQHLKANLKQEI